MIEVFGKDGRVFRFQNGTSQEFIKSAMDKHYGVEVTSPVAPTPPPPVPQAVSPPPSPPPAAYVPPQAQAAQSRPPYYDTQPRFQDDRPEPTNTAMQVTMLAGAAAVGILVVTSVLWATGMIGKKPEAAPSAAAVPAPAVSSAFIPTPQPDMRQALVATQIRKEPATDATVLREMVAGATIDVLGEQTIGGIAWLRVRKDQTSTDMGYVIASHLGAIGSAAPPLVIVGATNTVQAPTNSVKAPVKAAPVVAPTAPPVTPPPSNEGASTISRAPMGYYVQAGAARDKSETQDVLARSQEAESCIGKPPKVYASEAFVKTKTRGMALIAYGPFANREAAASLLSDLRPCIGDAFISQQPY
jgi:hypothetical protein